MSFSIRPDIQKLKRQIISSFYTIQHKKIFSQIYRNKVWGGKSEPFFSGFGSIPENATPYIELVQNFIRKHQITSVLDLGCGDFQIGSAINYDTATYTGIDVVPELVLRNQQRFGSPKHKFEHMNIHTKRLPTAQLCIIKQVFMHLSNNAIMNMLHKLNHFEYVLISDSWYADLAERKNEDIKSGSGRQKGLYLELPPFNQKLTTLLQYEIPTSDHIWTMRTVQLFMK